MARAGGLHSIGMREPGWRSAHIDVDASACVWSTGPRGRGDSAGRACIVRELKYASLSSFPSPCSCSPFIPSFSSLSPPLLCVIILLTHIPLVFKRIFLSRRALGACSLSPPSPSFLCRLSRAQKHKGARRPLGAHRTYPFLEGGTIASGGDVHTRVCVACAFWDSSPDAPVSSVLLRAPKPHLYPGGCCPA
ncbi:hypothetical protein B0H13DRAFT_312623 [Mycena leptocephala]|nr:hypothetical protein B0H13DRAFT_312623 [Mycena leptocephala]